MGFTYVVCSRIKSHENLTFDRNFRWQRMEAINGHARLVNIREEIHRIMNLNR